MVAVKRLDNGFRRVTMDEWAILWPPLLPSYPLVLPTYIDVDNDPIVTQLRHWMKGPPDCPAPRYPVDGYIGPARNIIQCNLEATTDYVWDRLYNTPLQIVMLYQKTKRGFIYTAANTRANGKMNPVENAVHPERVRQFQRLLAGHAGSITYRQLTECMGWGCRRDGNAVQMLLKKAMHSSAGYLFSADGVMFKDGINSLLGDVRIALRFLTRMRLGGADMQPLLTYLA